MASENPLRSRTSVVSTHSARQRKFSTDRLQRQAHQSLLNEEGTVARPSYVSEETADDNHVHFSDPDFENITTLSRAATGLSPLEMHPGQLANMNELMAFHPQYGSFSGPFPEPNYDGENTLPLQTAITPLDVEEAPGQIHEQGSQMTSGTAFVKRLYSQFRRGKAVRVDTAKGIEYGPAVRVTSNISHQPPALPKNRQVLYVLEYDKGLNEPCPWGFKKADQ